MAFDDFASFLQMGKHGVYVWSCYGIAVIVAFGNIWLARRDRLQFMRREANAMRRLAAANGEERT